MSRRSASSIFVFTKKTAFMQRIADLVRTGHTRFVQGEVSIERAQVLHDKFQRLYDINLSHLQASRRRKAGYATARMLFLAQEGQEKLLWVLLTTPGKFSIDGIEHLERWRDACKKGERIVVTSYELKRITKPQEPKPVWTWAYTAERERELREAIIGAIRRKSDQELAQLIHVAWRSPGFSGVRQQVKKFGQLIRAEWRRSRKESEPLPVIPGRIGYVQRLKDKGKPLSELLRSTQSITPD
jgi:hypothetical protein